jgi:hypothetical protein
LVFVAGLLVTAASEAQPGLREIAVFWGILILPILRVFVLLGFLSVRLVQEEPMVVSYLDRFASSAVKLVRFFKKSRDGWKAKYADTKKRCKYLANQTRAVERSRERWRERAALAEKRVAELEQQSEELKWDLEPRCCG